MLRISRITEPLGWRYRPRQGHWGTLVQKPTRNIQVSIKFLWHHLQSVGTFTRHPQSKTKLWLISKYRDVRNIPVDDCQFRFKSPSCTLYLFVPRRALSKNTVTRPHSWYDYESDQNKNQQISSPFNTEEYRGPTKPPNLILAPAENSTVVYLNETSPNTSLNQDSKFRPWNMPSLMITPGDKPRSNTTVK